jgi:hypothetical protein
MPDKSVDVASFKAIPLAIVDFLGALVPGLAWLSILFVLIDILMVGSINFDLVYSKAIVIFNSQSSVLQTVILIIYLAVGLIVGYMVKAFAMDAASFIESSFVAIYLLYRHPRALNRLYPHLEKQKSHLRRFGYVTKRCKFPYSIIHEKKPYLAIVKEIVKHHSDVTVQELPIKGPFSYCKRLIKISSPELWEESVQLEAEVRMLGSLFLAAFTSFFIAILASLITFKLALLKIAFVLLCLTILFGAAFSRRRRTEARYTYLNTILVWGKQKKELSKAVA